MSQFIKKQSGQAVLVILLIMAVGLTIGLSIASRGTSNVRFSTQIDESSRAFSAAEAGIESVLSQGLFAAGSTAGSISVGSADEAAYEVDVQVFGDSSSILTFPTVIEEGDGQTIWLVNHDVNGLVETPTYTSPTIDICWARQSTDSIIPALEVSVLFKETSNNTYKIIRQAYDPDSTRDNGFENSEISAICNDNGYDYYKQINFTDLAANANISGFNPTPGGGDLDILLALRLKPVYANAKIAVIPTNDQILPQQGRNIVSTGKTKSGVTRKWNVIQTYSAPTDLFDYAVWSNTDLTK